MIVVRRLLILFAIASGIGAILAKYWWVALHVVATPSAWLRCTNTLLFFAIALMLEELLALAWAKRIKESLPAGGQQSEMP
ncbi:MAG: hypothetical protein KAW89_05740 [Armatimonadetes bacterium]|nr:hypothetical protein [Armatimonadota bacterium]